MIFMKDLGWVVLIVLLMPLIMAVAFVAVAIILVQSIYRWARRNTTSTSRVGAPDASGADWWAPLQKWSGRGTRVSGTVPPAAPILAPAYATSRRRQP